MNRPRVLFVVEQGGWAFDRIARRVTDAYREQYDFNIVTVNELRSIESSVYVSSMIETDLVIPLWWAAIFTARKKVKFRRVAICVYDVFSWRGNPLFRRAARLADMIVAANGDLAKQIAADPDLPKLPVVVCEDGVDTEMFRPSPLPEALTASWCGHSMSGGGQLKGLDIARAACEAEGVPLLTADREVNPIPHDRIADELYARSSFGIYPSAGEGTPNPLLETMACGRPVVITPVGLAPWLVRDGVNGVIIGERTVDGVRAAIQKVKTMNLIEAGRLARADVERFDWRHKTRDWSAVLRLAEAD